jgi:hypothetical protein
MWIVDRARDLLWYPKRTWDKIKTEADPKLLVIYPLFLAVIPALAVYIGYGLIGLRLGPVGYYRMSFINAFYSALVYYVLSLLGVVVMGFLVMVLTNYFTAEADIFSAMKLAVYSATAPLLAGVFQVIPGIRILMVLGLYGAYIMYLGVPKLIRTTHEKEAPFSFSLIIAAVILMLLIDFLVSQYIFGIVYSEVLTL